MAHGRSTRSTILHRILPIACSAVLALTYLLALAELAHAGRVTPPPVPPGLEVPEGNRAFLVGHAAGTQNYVCQPSGSAFAWTLFTPVATLFDDRDKQLTTHFFSPNPFEGGIVRPTWQHSRDTSSVWVRPAAPPSSDPDYVEPGAIPWLLLEVTGAGAGFRGGDALTATTYIQRLNTWGGSAPATGCSAQGDVGARAYVPYEADYVFYRESVRGGHDALD